MEANGTKISQEAFYNSMTTNDELKETNKETKEINKKPKEMCKELNDTNQEAKGTNRGPKGTNEEHKDTKYSWVVCFATMGLFFLSFGTLRSSGVIFVALKNSFGTSRSENAIIFSTTFGSMFASCIISGLVVIRFGYRRPLIFGSILAASGPFFSYFVTDSRYFVLTLGLLEGLGFGTILIIILSINGHYFDRYLGTASGIAMSGSSLGTIVLPPAIEYLIDEYGIRGACLVHSGILFHFILFSMLIFDPPKKVVAYDKAFEAPHKQSDKDQSKEETKTDDNSSCQRGVTEINEQERFRGKMLKLLKSRYTYGISLMNAGVQTAVAGFSISIPDFAVLNGATLLDASYLMSISSVTDFMARLIIGFFIDKMKVNLCLSYSSVALGSALTFFLIALFGERSYTSLAVLCALFGFCYGGCLVHLPLNTTRYIGKEIAPLAHSISFFFSSIMAFSIAPIMAAMFQTFNGHTEFFYYLGGIYGFVFVFWFILGILEIRNERSERNMKS